MANQRKGHKFSLLTLLLGDDDLTGITSHDGGGQRRDHEIVAAPLSEDRGSVSDGDRPPQIPDRGFSSFVRRRRDPAVGSCPFVGSCVGDDQRRDDTNRNEYFCCTAFNLHGDDDLTGITTHDGGGGGGQRRDHEIVAAPTFEDRGSASDVNRLPQIPVRDVANNGSVGGNQTPRRDLEVLVCPKLERSGDRSQLVSIKDFANNDSVDGDKTPPNGRKVVSRPKLGLDWGSFGSSDKMLHRDLEVMAGPKLEHNRGGVRGVHKSRQIPVKDFDDNRSDFGDKTSQRVYKLEHDRGSVRDGDKSRQIPIRGFSSNEETSSGRLVKVVQSNGKTPWRP